MKAVLRSNFLLFRIVGVFGVLIGAYYAFAATELYETMVFQPYIRITADLSGRILGLLGYHVVADGSSLTSPQFSLGIAKGCDGLEPMAVFAAAVLAFSAPVLLKLSALAIGIPFLVALNLLRIVSLFLVGIFYPSLFHTIHIDVWQVLYLIVSIVCFALWLGWVIPRSAPIESASG